VLEIGPEVMLCLAEGVIIRSLSETDQYYAFNTITGDHFSLNDTVFWVLDTLGKPTGLAELELAYVETFGVNRTMGVKHLREVIALSLENALIKEVTL